MIRWIALFCLCLVACPEPAPEDSFDPLCESCLRDGERCDVSYNCAAGSICNKNPEEELYRPDKPANVCVRVVCETDADCEASRVCTLERICHDPICQDDGDCAEGTICVGGACGAQPSVAEVDRCVIVTVDQSLAPGGGVELAAIALDRGGAVVPRASFDWSSSDPSIARIDGAVAVAGSKEGTALVVAVLRERPSVRCTGLSIRTFGVVADGAVRVVAVDEQTGAALAGAEIFLVDTSSDTVSAVADERGAVLFPEIVSPRSVTVVKAGWKIVTVVSPESRDLFVVAPRANDFLRAGGIGGSVRLPEKPRGDFKAAIVSAARSLDLFDYKTMPIVDIVPMNLNAPELSLNMVSPLAGNLMLGFGDKQFSRDSTRCRGALPSSDRLGCFLTRMPAGRSAAWVMGGNLKISAAAQLSGEMYAVESFESFTSKDRARLMLLLSPLTQSLSFGALPYVEIETFPRIGRTADYSRYQHRDLDITERPGLESLIKVPLLPRNSMSTTISRYAILPGRGLLLLGTATVPDTQGCAGNHCEVLDEIPPPFGVNAPDLKKGELGLRAAPLHSGMEGSKQILVSAAVDTSEKKSSSLELNLIFERNDRVEYAHDLSTRQYLPFPEAAIDRFAGTVRVAKVGNRATGVRVAIEAAGGSWILFAPAGSSELVLPSVSAGADVLADSRVATVQAFESSADYAELFALGASRRIDRSLEYLRAIATSQAELR